jgi:hypothetical protein
LDIAWPFADGLVSDRDGKLPLLSELETDV